MQLKRHISIYRLLLLLILPILTLGTAQTADAPATSSIQSFMTVDEFRAAGLNKLTSTEIEKLNKWLDKYTLVVAKTILESTTTATPGRSVSQPSKHSVDSYIGGRIIADDGTFLGVISSSKYDSHSISNSFGTYGSKFQTDSIFNKFGLYGGEYSLQSPFNKFTRTPPAIYMKGEAVAYLTVNTSLSPRLDPKVLLAWVEENR